MSSSTAPVGYYEFSQHTGDGNVHISFTVVRDGMSQPVNMQLSVGATEKLVAGLHESLCRHRERQLNKLVAIDEALQETRRKDAEDRAAMLEALRLVADTESGWMSDKCRELVATAIGKATGND
jgi:transcriptional regulator CtsR